MPGKAVVFLTNSEAGQANVQLATASSVLLQNHNVSVHIISFSSIRSDVEATSRIATRLAGQQRQIHFHPLPGPSRGEAILQLFPHQSLVTHGWGFIAAARWYRIVGDMMMPWSADEYVRHFENIVTELEAIFAQAGGKHNVVCVIDSLFTPAVGAVRHLEARICLLSPNTLKELAIELQPSAAALWKYPVIGSGYPFPLPWYLIPMNILLTIWLVFQIHSSKPMKEKSKQLRQHEPPLLNNLLSPFRLGIPTICQNLIEADFSYKFIPNNITFCGPILRLSDSLAEADPELKKWLQGKRTIVINLGALISFTHSSASQIAQAIKLILCRHQDVQFLWKVSQGPHIPPAERFRPELILADEISSNAVKIVSWIPVELNELLSEGGIVAFVNHGGSSSWHEAIAAGIPQINLPTWADTYDFARRSEFLGIGIWGSKSSAPGYNAHELGQALINVLEGDRAAAMTANARRLAMLCQEQGKGRDIAAAKILQFFR